MMLPNGFEKWDEELKATVRYVLSHNKHLRPSGHGHECYFLGEHGCSLGFEINLPKDWTWNQVEPFMWKLAELYFKHQDLIDAENTRTATPQ